MSWRHTNEFATKLLWRLHAVRCTLQQRAPTRGSCHIHRPCDAQIRQSLSALNSMQQGAAANRDEVGSPLDGEIQGLKLVKQQVVVRGKALQLVAPRSVDSVIDLYIGNQSVQNTQDPYWCRIWPAAVALAQLLFDDLQLVRGTRVVELGCGLGVAGIAAGLAGARQVIVTDRDPLALRFALRSAKASGLSCSSEVVGSLNDACTSDSVQVMAAVLDWAAPMLDHWPGADVVLASDVMYDASAAEPLARLAPQLLQSGGTLLFADPEERTRHHRQDFLDRVCSSPEAGLVLERSWIESIEMDGITSKVRLLAFKQN